MVSNDCGEWLRFARMDMENVDLLMEQRIKKAEIILFHCQQTAEKALKAYLVNNNTWSGKIHDLVKLLQECAVIDNRFMGKRILDHCAFLDQYSKDIKYPFHNMAFDAKQLRRAVNSAKKVYDLVNEALGLERFYFK